MSPRITGPHDVERGRCPVPIWRQRRPRSRRHDSSIRSASSITTGLLYVADTYNHKHQTQVDAQDCVTANSLARQRSQPGREASTRWRLYEPARRLTLRTVTAVLIADTNNHRILAADLKTKAVREITIDGLTPPEKFEKPRDPSNEPAAVEAAAQEVKPGESLGFHVVFDLPEGYKLNKLGPVSYTLHAVGDQSLVAAEHLDGRAEATKGESRAAIEVPLAVREGKGDV